MYKMLFVFILLVFGTSANSAGPSELTKKQNLVEKNLKTKIPLEKKVKLLIAFKNWADKAILSDSNKLPEEELTDIMQYSNLLKAFNVKQLNPDNCKAAMNKVIDEDISPISQDVSKPAETLLHWLDLTCGKKSLN